MIVATFVVGTFFGIGLTAAAGWIDRARHRRALERDRAVRRAVVAAIREEAGSRGPEDVLERAGE